jgi:hypothetical protein
MSKMELLDLESFPPRQATHKGRWLPLYMEPRIGSGERICVGVVVADAHETRVLGVPDLNRLACAIGSVAHSVAWAAKLALSDLREQVAQEGIEAVSDWAARVDGMIVGDERTGAGRSLQDMANIALHQVSALVELDNAVVQPMVALDERGSGSRLDNQVRKLVSDRRPPLREHFGRTVRSGHTTRFVRYGFVGRRLAINFASLTAHSKQYVTTQVDKAKARLWDLDQLQRGLLSDSLQVPTQKFQYSLMLLLPGSNQAAEEAATKNIAFIRKEAQQELEAEADKFDIRVRPMASPEKIAEFILDEEAA